jgi:uncharacterized repeat protein (TIGR04138 family)
MDEMSDFISKLQTIVEHNSRYKLEAYTFILAALNYTVAKLDKPRHLTGQELCEGTREYALDQYGPLAPLVFEHWGITKTRDFGEIVFILVETGLMSKTPDDSLADFDGVYDFRGAFNMMTDLDVEDLDQNSPEDKKDVEGHD